VVKPGFVRAALQPFGKDARDAEPRIRQFQAARSCLVESNNRAHVLSDGAKYGAHVSPRPSECGRTQPVKRR
jgi:hypothetical protein